MKKVIVILCMNILVSSIFLGGMTAGENSIFFTTDTNDNEVLIVPISCPSSTREIKIVEQIYNTDTSVHQDQHVVSQYEKTNAHNHYQFLDAYDFVIITTEELSNAITSSTFIEWKTRVGHNIKIVLTTDSEITGQSGSNLPTKIRNFLREYHDIWGIIYVLFVGDYQTIPMRYCYPDPTNHYNGSGNPGTGGEIPTDYYYADLTASDSDSWDSDGDGYYGEFGHDNPDFKAEVYVGRIPTSISSRITYTLDKTVTFEQNTGIWKNATLHAGAFYYFTNEDNSGNPAMDAARSLQAIEQDIMDGWAITHFSEQEGLEKSVYNWSTLTQNAFIGSWREGTFGVVNWGSHAYMNRAARKVWDWDDGDNIPEAHEIKWPDFINDYSNLDDDYPSIVFAVGCLIGTPEKNAYGNLGIDLVTKPDYGSAVTIISSTRTPYGALNWTPASGGAESISYEFNRFMINDSNPVGEALYTSKYFCTENYGWNLWYEYNNLYVFNLYGDPSLVRGGIYVSPRPDLECEGSLSWSKISPGSKITGNFSVKNIGDSTSLLNWTVESYPSWGVWTFSPINGQNLTPEGSPITIQVEVIAPEERNTKFEGEIKIVNLNDSTDSDSIPVILHTPKSKLYTFNIPLFYRLVEQFSHAFPILRLFLTNFL